MRINGVTNGKLKTPLKVERDLKNVLGTFKTEILKIFKNIQLDGPRIRRSYKKCLYHACNYRQKAFSRKLFLFD